MTSRIFSRASRALLNTSAMKSDGSADSLMSSWTAVTPSSVPATLKSMSPNASSIPAMSVSTLYSLASGVDIKPIAIPATGALIGTPASISANVEAQTDACEVEPFEASTSETTRIV